MKKAAVLLSGLGYLALATMAVAQPIPINLPTNLGGIAADTPLNTVISNVLKIVFAIAALAVLFMLVIGSFQWITSGGDKEAVGKARGRITNALIGLAILALAVFIVTIVARILGFANPFDQIINPINTPL